MIVSSYIQKTGINLLADNAALSRLEEAAKKAVSELATSDKATIYIPYISANSNGPLHLNETIDRTELNNFILRYNNNTNRKNDTNHFLSDGQTVTSSNNNIQKNENIVNNDIYRFGDGQAEKLCEACGRKIPVNSVFCCYCGSKNSNISIQPVPTDIYCKICGNKISSDSIYCRCCGALIPQTEGIYVRQTTLLIKRDMQFVCSAVFFKVVVDGIDYGNINIGQSKQVNVTSQIVFVEIICTTIMLTNYKLRMRLKIGNNPCINFKVQYPAEIIPTIIDAEIMEKY
jgi:hypothetical protein